ncbi:hypothetical protein BANRA_01338 [Acinetobacter baumannii]|nr:hypothetical protein BANRA_01338 [Acinetobacter baumannii]
MVLFKYTYCKLVHLLLCYSYNSFLFQNTNLNLQIFGMDLFFLVSLPTVALSPYIADSFYTGSITCLILLISNSLIFCVSSINEYKLIPRFKGFSLTDLKYLIIFASLFLIILVYLNFGFHIRKLLDLSIFTDTYEIRADFRDVKSGIGALSSYSIYWLAKFLPFLFVMVLLLKIKIYLYRCFITTGYFHRFCTQKFCFSALLVLLYIFINEKYSFTQWLATANLFLLFSVIFITFLGLIC